MKDIRNDIKSFIGNGNVLSTIITLICAAIAYFGGNVQPDAVGNVVAAISAKQIFAIVVAITVNIITPLAYILVKRPKSEPWWGFLRSRNFGVNVLNLIFLGIASSGYTVPEGTATSIWTAIEGKDWGALGAVLATSVWGLISSYFSKKMKDAQPPAAAPIAFLKSRLPKGHPF
jgi:hypothetical protein